MYRTVGRIRMDKSAVKHLGVASGKSEIYSVKSISSEIGIKLEKADLILGRLFISSFSRKHHRLGQLGPHIRKLEHPGKILRHNLHQILRRNRRQILQRN